MKFKIVTNNNKVELICANGEYVGDLKPQAALSYLAHFDASFPGSTPELIKEMEDYNGETLISLRDDGVLEIHNIEYFRELLTPKEFPYYTIKEFCENSIEGKKGRVIVNRMCREGRIEGAVFSGDVWYIPKTAKYPSRKERTKKTKSND